MKFLCIGDVHIKLSALPEIPILKNEIQRVKEELVGSNYLEKIVVLGDLHHDFDKMNLQCWEAIEDFIQFLTKLVYDPDDIVYIVGNHDYLNNTAYDQKSHWMKRFHYITVVDEMQVFRAKDQPVTDKHGNTSFQHVYWAATNYMSPGKMVEEYRFKGFDKKDISVVFAHQEFLGIKMGAIESSKGDDWPQDYPPVINGHIHDNLVHNNIYCVGSPRFTGFGETGQRYLGFVEVLPGSFYYKNIPINMPRKETVSMSVLQLESFTPDKNDVLRILLVDKPENIEVFKKTAKYKELILLSNVKIVPKPLVEIARNGNYNTLSFEQIVLNRAMESGVGDTFKELLDAFNTQKL